MGQIFKETVMIGAVLIGLYLVLVKAQPDAVAGIFKSGGNFIDTTITDLQGR